MLNTRAHKKAEAAGLSTPLTMLARAQLESPGFSPAATLCAILAHIEGGGLLTLSDEAGLRMALGFRDRALPLPVRESWITPLTSGGVPIVHGHEPGAAVSSLLQSLTKPLLLRAIPVESEVYRLLCENGELAELARWERAVLRPSGSYEAWLTQNFDHKRRKEFKRLRARLAETGELLSTSLAQGQDPEPFIADLLALEAGGWKAERGTALAQTPAHAAALRQALGALHAEGKLRFWRIHLDGKAIAALFAIVENGTATLGKIAYDETLAKYSPGVMVIFDATASLFSEPGVNLADSNAIPDHPMINRIWRERMTLVDILVKPAKMRTIRFKSTELAERARQALRSSAKQVYYRLKNRTR